jgi:hypothetical protein
MPQTTLSPLRYFDPALLARAWHGQDYIKVTHPALRMFLESLRVYMLEVLEKRNEDQQTIEAFIDTVMQSRLLLSAHEAGADMTQVSEAMVLMLFSGVACLDDESKLEVFQQYRRDPDANQVFLDKLLAAVPN